MKQNDCRGAYIRKKTFAEEKFFIPPPIPRKIIRSFSNDDGNGDG